VPQGVIEPGPLTGTHTVREPVQMGGYRRYFLSEVSAMPPRGMEMDFEEDDAGTSEGVDPADGDAYWPGVMRATQAEAITRTPGDLAQVEMLYETEEAPDDCPTLLWEHDKVVGVNTMGENIKVGDHVYCLLVGTVTGITTFGHNSTPRLTVKETTTKGDQPPLVSGLFPVRTVRLLDTPKLLVHADWLDDQGYGQAADKLREKFGTEEINGKS
jgi:hypothetical protein